VLYCFFLEKYVSREDLTSFDFHIGRSSSIAKSFCNLEDEGKHKEPLKRVEDSTSIVAKEKLGCFSETRDRECENEEEPGETKEKQYTTDTDHKAHD
jgi:hypothetical protein